MRKLIFAILALVFLGAPAVIKAQETQIICPQPYGGGVVCGVHTPVATGLGDNLAILGIGLLVASLVFVVLSKKFNRVSA